MEYIDSNQKMIWEGGKSKKELRYKDFCDIWLYDFSEICMIKKHTNDSFTFEIEGMAGTGKIDFYPKSNKILIRQQNKWINNGLQWLVNKLLK